MNSRSKNTRFLLFFTHLLPFALLIAFFLPSASPDLQYSYRDVSYYYYPLFELVQECWESGKLPLWNPYVNLGQPLAGDPTSSVFYPGKILFFLSSIGICSFNTCFKLYLWTHIALAFFSSQKLAYSIGVSRSGATLSGISYAFSGQVLFQYTNVIYLVGASWAPLSILFAKQYFTSIDCRSRVHALLLLSLVSALSILGGEPQIVYLTLLCSVVGGLVYTTCNKRHSLVSTTTKRTRPSNKLCLMSYITNKTLVFVVIVPLVITLLSAIQILPSLEIVSRSTRTNNNTALSIWEIPKAYFHAQKNGEKTILQHRDFYKGILCEDMSLHGRNSSIYRFSVGPWRWLEYLTPNIGGKQFPQSARWFELFPEELSVWTPTLYFGVIPFLLAVASFSFRINSTEPNFAVAASWLTLFGLLGSLGGYGLGWAVHGVINTFSGTPIPSVFSDRDPVGGLYWFLNLTIPKFAEFRYPAKLLTLSAIGFSILAGIGWDTKRFSPSFRRLLIAASTLMLFLLLGMFFWGSNLLSKLSIPPNPLFGPFQHSIAQHAIIVSCGQTLVVLLIASLLLKKPCQKPSEHRLGYSQTPQTIAFFLLITVDIFFANHQLIIASPTSLVCHSTVTEEKKFNPLLCDPTKEKYNSTPPLRVYRYPIWFPPLFQQETSSRRIDERVLWDVYTLYPMYPTRKRIAILDFRGAVMESSYAHYIDTAINRTQLDDELAFLDVHFILGPQFWTERISPTSKVVSESPFVNWNLVFKEIHSFPTRVALFHNGQRIDDRITNRIDVLAYESNQITILVDATQDSELILAEQFWPDWKGTIIPISKKLYAELLDAQYSSNEVNELVQKAYSEAINNSDTPIVTSQIQPEFEFLRKLNLKQGKSCIIIKYIPQKLYLGFVISVTSWITMLILLILTKRQNIIRMRAHKNTSNKFIIEM